ncbi:MAG: hypothetical protein COB85_07855 [Bacteroidetes bacterium]|nr:MAG: hypothetical protein COB85_07855 [Bacteroidota bacterium]
MESIGLEKRICPFDGEEFQPSRTNQTYCCYEHQYKDYNRKKAEKRKEARKYINAILSNWDLSFDILASPSIPDNKVTKEFLLENGFKEGFITHYGVDPEDKENVFRICEFGYKIITGKYQFSKY